MVEIVNIVAGGELGVEIDLEAFARDIEDHETEYDPERYWQLVIRFREHDSLIILYRTGKYIVRGGGSYEDLSSTEHAFTELLMRHGIITSSDQTTFDILNIVCTGTLNTEIDLETACIQLGLEHTEYEPELFPGLVYRPLNTNAVLLVFSSGKVVVTSVLDEGDAEAAIDHLQSELALG